MKILVYINFFATLVLVAIVSWLIAFTKPFSNTEDVVVKSGEQISNNDLTLETSPDSAKCSDSCQKEIDEAVNRAVSTVSGQAGEANKTVKTTTAPQPKSLQVSYIPIAGPITTTSSAWYDAPGTDFYLNIGDYGKDAYVTWDANLKVAHGNGTAYARIYDATHGIAVNGSEVSLSDNPTLTQVSSGGLSFWSGRNLYRVQIKSLNTFEVTFGSGRVKINY